MNRIYDVREIFTRTTDLDSNTQKLIIPAKANAYTMHIAHIQLCKHAMKQVMCQKNEQSNQKISYHLNAVPSLTIKFYVKC